MRTFQEWMRYRYGVFSEVGFPNDPMYPAYYHVGPEIRKNEGCNTTLLANEEKYQTSSSNNSSSTIGISRQMVSRLYNFLSHNEIENFLKKLSH